MSPIQASIIRKMEQEGWNSCVEKTMVNRTENTRLQDSRFCYICSSQYVYFLQIIYAHYNLILLNIKTRGTKCRLINYGSIRMLKNV